MTTDALEAQWVEREVRWMLQTWKEVAIENAVFFRFLEERVGVDLAKPWIEDYLDQMEKEIQRRGTPGREAKEAVWMLKVEGGLTFWPYLNGNKTFNAKDPINAIFWNYGAASIVSDLLQNRVGGWSSTQGATLYAYIDDSSHGGTMDWKKFDVQLRKGSFWTSSHHVRIYEGFCSCNHGKSVYSIAGVHEEQFLTWPPILGCVQGHRPVSWDNARNVLENDVQSVPASVNSPVRVNLNTAGVFQGIQHDGHASYVEFIRPHWLSSI